MVIPPFGRAAVAALSLALAVSEAPAYAAQDIVAGFRSEAASAARWQASQLTHGRIHNGQFDFDDWGLTIDTAFALADQGGQPRRLRRLTTALENNYFKDYVTAFGGYYAGALAKTLVAAEVLHAGLRDFDGRDLRSRVLQRVAGPGAGFEAGRVRDRGASDTSNTFAQSYAVLGLARSGKAPARVVDYLLKQQCHGGYFRLTEVAGERCRAADSASSPDVDATSIAIQALLAARQHGARLPNGAISRAVTWLLAKQKPNGAFGGGVQTAGINTNSTGLAAQALAATHHLRASRHAAAWVATLQITRAKAGDGPARRDVGAIAYNHAALKVALDAGIRTPTRDQFRRATPAAIFAFLPRPLGTLTER